MLDGHRKNASRTVKANGAGRRWGSPEGCDTVRLFIRIRFYAKLAIPFFPGIQVDDGDNGDCDEEA